MQQTILTAGEISRAVDLYRIGPLFICPADVSLVKAGLAELISSRFNVKERLKAAQELTADRDILGRSKCDRLSDDHRSSFFVWPRRDFRERFYTQQGNVQRQWWPADVSFADYTNP